ncbi:MAG TPA: hypothetical protein VE988_19970 [Gemmataceae bacterium]|nr:hypothetical protein [Gemmataceae bacterium]
MNLFAPILRLFRSQSKRPSGRKKDSRIHLCLECLESRTLLNNRFVIPTALVPDNVTNFATLQAALTTAGLAAGNVIQIEPGSTPGNIVNANIPALANLTIQGDPAVAAAEVPAFGVNDAVTIAAAQAGITFQNVKMNLLGGGLTFNANGTVARSVITDNFAGTALNFNAITQGNLLSNVIVANSGAAAGDVVRVNTAAAANNLISGNTFVSTAAVDHVLLHYFGANTITDKVVGNTLIGNSGFSGRPLILVDALGMNGLSIQDNTLRDADSNQVAIAVGVGNQNITIARNTVNLTGATGTAGINVVGGGPNPTSVRLSDNIINTNGHGTGIQFLRTLSGGTLNARVEGNDLHTNLIGVLISGNIAGSVTGIDLGGGSQGSLGGNNFRGFTGVASATAGAIVTSALTADGPISANLNLFGTANPETAIFDQGDTATLADVNAVGNLTGNPAFVQTLYCEFLKRPGDLGTLGDAGGWVSLLNSGTPANTVANAIIRSPEALGLRVDSLYRQFLKRESDPAGRAAFVGLLQTGTTQEGAIKIITTSGEYHLLNGSDGSFVQSLAVNLLNRAAGTTNPTELANWVAMVQAEGRATTVDSFLSSAEYRTVTLQHYYADLLNRSTPPAASEVNAWLGTGLDLLTIEVLFASGPEFQANG